MAVQGRQRMSVEDFEAFIHQPGHADRDWEYIAGEVHEVVSNNYSSEIAARITVYLGTFVMRFNLGRLTVTDGGYVIAGERYIPDVAYISYARQPQPSHAAYNPNPPDLAVEVLSPTNDDEKMRVKITHYLLVGVVVWVVNPEARTVEVYTPGEPVRILGPEDTLEGGPVLPGFSLAVKDIFPPADAQQG